MFGSPFQRLIQVVILLMVFVPTMAGRVFHTPNKHPSKKTIELRGGAISFDSVTTTKAFTVLGVAVGTTTMVSTKAVVEKSGLKDVDPISLLTIRRIGGSILTFSIAAYFLLFQESSAATAVAISSLVAVVELYKGLFDGTHRELEYPAEGQVFVLGVTAILSYGLLYDAPFSKDTALKIHSIWNLLNGFLLGLFPSLACKAYGNMDSVGSSLLLTSVSTWGFDLISIGILSGCLATGMDATKAIAYGALPFIFRLTVNSFRSGSLCLW